MESGDLFQQVIEHLRVFGLAIALSLTSGSMAWYYNFFSWHVSSLPVAQIKGQDVLRGFAFFLLMHLVIVPSLIIVAISIKKGSIHHDPTILIDPIFQGWAGLLTVLGGGAGVYGAYLYIPYFQKQLIWGRSERIWPAFKMGIITWFISYPFVMALSQLIAIIVLVIFQQPEEDQVAVKYLKMAVADPFLLTVTILAIVVIVPLVEEMLFRGLLQTWLRQKLDRNWAIIFTSILFAFFHFSISQGLRNIELFFSLFVLSCFLGFLYERERCLLAPVGLHAFFNAVSTLLIVINS
jgi:uncharacterized protein